jgi:hypothetical protein
MSTETLKKTNVKMQLRDIMLDITWSKISRRYFDKSASWIYNKMNGVDGNGGCGDFTYSEKLQLQQALYDFADRIRNAAKEIT